MSKFIGGSWGYTQSHIRSAYSYRSPLEVRSYDLGFRVVQDAEDRVLRGGSWGDLPGNLRSASRIRLPPGPRGLSIGFRVVRDE